MEVAGAHVDGYDHASTLLRRYRRWEGVPHMARLVGVRKGRRGDRTGERPSPREIRPFARVVGHRWSTRLRC